MNHLQQLSACPHHTSHLIMCARSSDATQYYLHPKVYPWEQCPIKLTCLLPSKSCYTNNVTHSNRLTGLQPSLEHRICAKNKHEKDSARWLFMNLCETHVFKKIKTFQQTTSSSISLHHLIISVPFSPTLFLFLITDSSSTYLADATGLRGRGHNCLLRKWVICPNLIFIYWKRLNY